MQDSLFSSSFHPPSSLDLSTDKTWKCQIEWRSKQKSGRRKSSVLFLEYETWFFKRSLKKAKKTAVLFVTNSDAKNWACELKVWPATGSHFRNSVNCKRYCLLDKSQTFRKNTATRTIKYAKCIKPLMKGTSLMRGTLLRNYIS